MPFGIGQLVDRGAASVAAGARQYLRECDKTQQEIKSNKETIGERFKKAPERIARTVENVAKAMLDRAAK